MMKMAKRMLNTAVSANAYPKGKLDDINTPIV